MKKGSNMKERIKMSRRWKRRQKGEEERCKSERRGRKEKTP
jgi:hypothetical protein